MAEQVVFKGINKSFGDAAAVVDLNLGIEKGEFFTLLGPSGSGKTTTLRMLAGLESATSGEIEIDNELITHTVPEKRNIGLVFQHYALFPHMTVADNVAFPLKMRRTSKTDITTKVNDVLSMTQLSDYRKRYPRELSGGQQQRVALARAFVFSPSILLMDEPLGALDRNLRDHMRLELKSLQQRIDATVLYVTHDQDEALAMSDRIGIMNNGRLLQVAPPNEMYERPANSFVAKFLGDSVCLPATRSRPNGSCALEVEQLSGRVRIDPSTNLCDDDTGVMVVRPEKFVLHNSEPGVSDDNCVSGVVEASVYLGSDHQVYLRDDSGARIQVSSPAAAGAIDVGSRQWLTWRPTDTLFLPVAD
ncbi:ABC transporter ATP-binding protein [Nakamurella lactea]|uniref:ABC transporter ATP-binding protein n=1 Tax=Nakamurella lactea TaxID=459515 RepID=UPI0004018976|nr:ABC transporter ATP-binding protein [Nakamurella lactea]